MELYLSKDEPFVDMIDRIHNDFFGPQGKNTQLIKAEESSMEYAQN